MTWEQWHRLYDDSPEFRAALAEYHELRKRARINRQLANAVTVGGTCPVVYRRVGEHWIKGKTAAARWAESQKRRFRESFAKRLKIARKKIGGMKAWRPRPGKACDGRIARQYKGKYTDGLTFEERETRWICNVTPTPNYERAA